MKSARMIPLGPLGLLCLLAAWIPPAHAVESAGFPGPRFVQDRFVISFWVDPPLDEQTDARYAELAGAGFNVVIGHHAATPETVARQLELCGRHGLKAIVRTAGVPPEKLPEHPACWGYELADEPGAPAFEGLGRMVETIRRARPGRLGYINLFPDYASPAQLGNANYDEHVREFIRIVRPDVLSMDHYPQFRPDADGRGGYCRNLEVMRRESLAAGIPFWNFFNVMPFGPHTDPTEAQIRWQVFTSLAYGAKGVMYFCYWTPRGGEFPRGGAIITPDGRRTRHYDEARRVNTVLNRWGPVLMRLSSTGVCRVEPGQEAAALKGGPLRRLVDGDCLLGSFRHADGRRAVLILNYHFAYAAWPTVTFDAEPSQVAEICPRTGREIPLRDDSPDMPGWQLALDAGEGRLFLLPEGSLP